MFGLLFVFINLCKWSKVQGNLIWISFNQSVHSYCSVLRD